MFLDQSTDLRRGCSSADGTVTSSTNWWCCAWFTTGHSWLFWLSGHTWFTLGLPLTPNLFPWGILGITVLSQFPRSTATAVPTVRLCCCQSRACSHWSCVWAGAELGEDRVFCSGNHFSLVEPVELQCPSCQLMLALPKRRFEGMGGVFCAWHFSWPCPGSLSIVALSAAVRFPWSRNPPCSLPVLECSSSHGAGTEAAHFVTPQEQQQS